MANPSQQQRRGPFAISPWLGFLPRALWRRQKDFFIYSAEFLPLGAGQTLAFDTAIQADSDFTCVAVSRVIDNNAAPPVIQAVAPILVQVFDTGSGRSIFDRQQHLENFAGTIELPHYLEYPKVFAASSTIQTTLQNQNGAQAFNVRIAFLGFKVFNYKES